MGGPIVRERKGREPIGCPDVKHLGMSQLDTVLTGVPLTLKIQGQIVTQEWEARLSWNERDALMWNMKEMSQLDAVLTGVLLTLTFDLEFSRSNCISGMGGWIVMEWTGRESIGGPDVKYNHYVTLRQRILLGTGVTSDVGVFVDSSSLIQISLKFVPSEVQ